MERNFTFSKGVIHGIQLSQNLSQAGQYTIESVQPGSEGEENGLFQDLVVTKINDLQCSDLSPQEVSTILKDYTKPLKLTIVSNSSNNQLEKLLQENDLDPLVWVPILKNLGITSTKQITEYQVSFNSLQILHSKASELHVNTKVLQGLFGIEELKFSEDLTIFSKRLSDYAADLKKQSFIQLLEKIGLLEKHPGAITKNKNGEIKQPQPIDLWEALTIHNEPPSNSVKHYPYLILQKIMVADNRFPLLKLPANSLVIERDSESESEDSTDSESEGEDASLKINPMDVSLALLHCCNPLLQQDLLVKLCYSQLAVPLLLPDPWTGKVTFLLWAIRKISIAWKTKKPETKIGQQPTTKECSIADQPLPIVTFIRLGKLITSKSKFLNHLIADRYHSFFFNRECKGGNSKRYFADGSIEFCCYLPSGKETDLYSSAIMFANLRGNAKNYLQQIKFIGNISIICFAFLADEDLTSSDIQILESLQHVPGGLTVMKCKSKMHGKKRKPKESMLSNIKCQIINLASKKKNLEENCECVRIQLEKDLKTAQATNMGGFTVLSNCINAASKAGIEIDENETSCIEGKTLAEEALNKLKVPYKNNACKQSVVPLQGQDMWYNWAYLNKELQRHDKLTDNDTLEDYNDTITNKKKTIRINQLEKSKTSSPAMKLFVQLLETSDSRNQLRSFFLRWLQLLLDNISRTVTPELQIKYNMARSKLKEEIVTDIEEAITKSREDFEKSNDELILASFGIEHLFREVGQLFECRNDPQITNEINSKLQDEVKIYPDIMVNIMEEGYPIELMDGDASHVPLTWIKHIIKALKKRYKAKRIYIISVLGVQSSGKSTLLNAIFGLSFSVRAGRCTRGAFMQLLPVKSSADSQIHCECDYFLIIDTEGLRAPELQSVVGLPKRDNELATFVIGIADITIININGETAGDMDDILQTAVHAFIRMTNVSLKPSCKFVHQNVAAVTADNHTTTGRSTFIDKLDKMTRHAAELESCEEKLMSFKSVIHFSEDEDIFYFPNLWEGSPPMAPINPQYIEQAQNLKLNIIKSISKTAHALEFYEFLTRIDDLWKSVLTEKFVFSFKNTIEVLAYRELDKNLAAWEWKIRSKILDLETKAKYAIQSCKTTKSISNKESKWISSAMDELRMVYDEQCKAMDTFFQNGNGDYLHYLLQWEASTAKRLKDLLNESYRHISSIWKEKAIHRERQFKVQDINNSHHHELKKHIKHLVKQYKECGEELNQKDVETYFEVIWKDWVTDIEKKSSEIKYVTDKVIDDSVRKCLMKIMVKDYDKVRQKLRKRFINEWGYSLKLELNATHTRKKLLKVFKHTRKLATTKTSEYFDTAKANLDAKTDNFDNFHEFEMHQLLEKLHTSIETFNNEKNNVFRFTSEYFVEMALTVGGYAVKHYKRLMEEKLKDDPVKSLEERKVLFLNMFKNGCNKLAQEDTAAENFCIYILECIRITQIDMLPKEIVDMMKVSDNMFLTKLGFKTKVLESLAYENEFEFYIDPYLTDSEDSSLYWSRQYVINFCSEKSNGKSHFMKISERLFQKLTHSVFDRLQTGEISRTVDQWIQLFHNKLCDTLPIDISVLQMIFGECTQSKLETLVSAVKIKFDKARKEYRQPDCNYDYLFAKVEKPPHVLLLESITGCTERCPFCNEQCDLSSPTHVQVCQHSIKVHSPLCIKGYRWIETGALILESCPTLVASDKTFENDDTDNKPTPYHEYRKIYKDWYIPEEMCETPPFWKWFICKHRSKIAKKYELKLEPPKGWTEVSRDVALHTLKSSYNLT